MQALQDHTDITSRLYADPHNPHLHLGRGLIHERLGFPDLASADAYRALSLLDSVVDPEGCEFHARRRIGGGVGDGDVDVEVDDDGNDEEDAYAPITEDEYNALVGPVYALLVRSLVRCGCLRDAYEFALRGLALLRELAIASQATEEEKEGKEKEEGGSSATAATILQEQLALIKAKYHEGKRPASATDDDVDPRALKAQGFARRILYPWNQHEPDRKAPETLRLLNERLRVVAPKCEVRAVALPALHSTTKTETEGEKDGGEEEEEEVSIQLGLFAKEDLHPGEIILHETSLLTATNRLHDDLCDACNAPLPDLASAQPPVACADCDDTIFCSQFCHDRAQETYHAAVCGLMDGLDSIGKDIPDPKDKADYLYLLLLGRALAMAATQDTHPLDLPEVKYIWGDFHDFTLFPSPPPSTTTTTTTTNNTDSTATLPFSFQLNILLPQRILEEMEIDPYATLPRHDTWILNTLYAKFRGTASGRLSTWDGGPELCAVHPLWCLANHSCDPNVRWEWGGEITFRVRGEEERAVWKRAVTAATTATPTDELDQPDQLDQRQSGVPWRGIAKDEEILNHYCDIGLGVKERREWARGALGGMCLCDRCVWEAGEEMRR